MSTRRPAPKGRAPAAKARAAKASAAAVRGRRLAVGALVSVVLVGFLLIGVFPTRDWLDQRSETDAAERRLARIEAEQVAYEERVAPGLVLPRQIGNIYTGALYLSLASTLLMSQRDLEGARLGLFSYGSGSCAEFFDCTVCEMAQGYARQANWTAMLDRQTVIDVPEYERLVRARDERAALRDVVPLAGEGPAFLGSRDRYRHYEG